MWAVFENGERKKINKKDIRLYIKEGERKKKCSTLEIISGNSYLKEGLVIIDTPGANINKYEHNLQRKKAIKESSVGIFLISCQSLTSKSFMEFLKENKDELQKVIFVLTKVDIYEDEEISIDMDNKTPKQKLRSSLEYVTSVIKEYGGIKQPQVFSVSSKAFIEKRKLKVIDVEKSFNNVVDKIKDSALKDKKSIIQKEIEKILSQIIKELNYLLEKRDVDCKKEIQKVNGEIQEFDKLISSISREFSSSLDSDILSRKNRIRSKLQGFKRECLNSVENEINKIDTLSSFKEKADTIVKDEYRYFENKCCSYINEEVRSLGLSEFQKAELELKKYFENIEKTYKHLGIQQKLTRKKILISLILSLPIYCIFKVIIGKSFMISILLSFIMFFISYIVQKKRIDFYIPSGSYTSMTVSLENRNSITTVGGIDETHTTGGGLLIGAFLGGPLGAIVGAGIGALIGSFFSGEKLMKARDGLFKAVEGDLVNQCVKFGENLNVTMSKQKDQLEINLQKYIKDNKNLYAVLLKGIEDYNSGMFVRLTDIQKLSKMYCRELQKFTSL
ncbi:dynamin family protein [Clostridium sartagoforme]